jgi:S1-C subfamily serine protease
MTSWRVLVAGLLALLVLAGPIGEARAAGTEEGGARESTEQPAGGRPWLGLQLRGGNAEQSGVPIQGVAEGSPAAAAGIQAGDTLLAVDGEVAAGARAVVERIGAMAPGTAVTLRILHAGQASDVTVTLGTRPE